ncbi:Hypothetical predicted protein [Pelobates cultripes]|uniref:Uncharacterized protein n=1 Tax=Pelobates cultripes TaxID=61616 RepID=A0AAD1WEM0_PELCU|nr:Hypothetical predicted protein [Pelobates cultripes]
MGWKVHRKVKAYPLTQPLYSLNSPLTENWTSEPSADMGRKSQRIATGACEGAGDIGAMLQRPAAPKMAAMPDPDTGSICSEQALGDTTDPQSSLDEQIDPDVLTPATKLDIRNH